MVIFNKKLVDYNNEAQKLDKVLQEMSIRKVIEDSFGGDRESRAVEQNILTGEDNQKSVNAYLIQKIHTLEDRINAKFDREQADMTALKSSQTAEDAKLMEAIKERELKSEKQHRELKAQLTEVRD